MLLNENQENNKVDSNGKPKVGLSPTDLFGEEDGKLLQVPKSKP